MPRKAPVRVTLIERTCADCGRTALDVRIDHDGSPRCYSQVGCQGRAYRARSSWRNG